MNKIFLMGLASLIFFSSAMANYTPIYQTITTKFYIYSLPSVPAVHATTGMGVKVDGDYADLGGYGYPYEFNTTIMAKSDQAAGTLHLLITWLRTTGEQDVYCAAHAPLDIPLKIENHKIVIPTQKYVIYEKEIVFSDDKCRESGPNAISVKISGNPGGRYLIDAEGFRSNI